MLKRRGYTVQFEGFVELCKENSRYSPQGSVVSIKWVSYMFTAMERFLHQFEEVGSPCPLSVLCGSTAHHQAEEGRVQGQIGIFRSLLPHAVRLHARLSEQSLRVRCNEVRILVDRCLLPL